MSDPRINPMLPFDQTWLINRLKKISNNVDDKGICFGLSAMSMQAIFLNDLSTFTRRLELIYAMPENTFVEEIDKLNKKRIEIIEQVKKEIGPMRELSQHETAEILAIQENKNALLKLEETIKTLAEEGKALDEKEKNRRKNSLLFNAFVQKKIEEKKSTLFSEDERIKLDIPVFLEGVIRYQDFLLNLPALEKETNSISQSIMLTFPLVASVQLKKEGGISKRRDFSGVYSMDELTQYFNLFTQATSTTHVESTKPLVFVLCSSNHAILLGYDPVTSTWSCTDANHLPTKYTADAKELAQYVIDAFFSHNKEVVFSTDIYCSKADINTFEPAIAVCENQQEWKAMHAVSTDKVKSTDSYAASWLFVAAQKGHLDIVKALLAAGAKPNQARDDGFTPLIVAIHSGYLDIVNALLAAGAKPNQARNGFTPLYIAVEKGHLDIVKALLAAEAKPDQATDDGFTPLFIAVDSGRLDIVNALLATRAHRNITINGITLLFRAVENGHLEIVKALLAAGADPNRASTDDYVTPLFIAVKSGRLDIVNALLAAEADPTHPSLPYVTPLFIAVESGRPDIVNALLAAGADPNEARIGDGATPLLIAADKGDFEMVETLLAGGAQPNKVSTDDGYSPLFIAAQDGNLKIINLLLQYHASLAPKFKITCDKLRHLAQELNKQPEVEALIKIRQTSPASETIIISAKDIATVIGQHAVVERLEQEEKKMAAALKTSGLFANPTSTVETSSPDNTESPRIKK